MTKDPRIIAREGSYYLRADAVREGDLLDLEGDSYADPGGEDDRGLNSFEFAFAEVIEPPVVESSDCILIHTDQGSFGFPPDHEIETELREDIDQID